MPRSPLLKFFKRHDLHHRSFRDRDLSGLPFFYGQDCTETDFSGCDLRGCDFSQATLSEANFEKAQTGWNCSAVFYLIYSFLLAAAFFGALAGLIMGLGIYIINSELFQMSSATDPIIGGVIGNFVSYFFAFIVTAVVMGTVLGFGNPIGNAAKFAVGLYIFIFMFVGSIVITFAIIAKSFFEDELLIHGIAQSFICLLLSLENFLVFFRLVEAIKNSAGTSFANADLTKANFRNTTLRNTDFSRAKLNQVDWKNAKIYRCKFTIAIEVIELCSSRNGREKSYCNADLNSLNLSAAILVDSDLNSSDLSGTNLTQAYLENANLSSVRAWGTDFSGATMTGACIEDWAINAETKFTDVRCDYIYLRQNQQERRPESGFFKPGDFARLLATFSETLDLIFRREDDLEAFLIALRKLNEENRDADLSIQSIEDLGQGEGRVRLNANNSQVDKAQFREEFDRNYEILQKQLQAKREKVVVLEAELSITRERHTSFLERLVYHQTDRLSRPRIQASTAHFSGDVMAEQGNKIQFGNVDGNVSGVVGGDLSGIVAGGDLSGTVSQMLGQLRDASDPEAAQVADLLAQLQAAIDREATALTARDKANALKHLQTIGEAAQDRQDPSLRERAEDSLDALTGILGKANKLWAAAKPWVNGVRRIFGFLFLG